jgi:cell division control protein 6
LKQWKYLILLAVFPLGMKKGVSKSSTSVERSGTPGAILDEVVQNTKPLYSGDTDILTDTWVPPKLLYREREIRQLFRLLLPLLNGNSPPHIVIFGLTGTGKTVVVNQVLHTLRDRRLELPLVYVNCKDSDTEYEALRSILNDLRRDTVKPVGYKLGVAALVSELRSFMADHNNAPMTIVLDEIDHLVKESGDHILYSLTELNRRGQRRTVSLIGISNNFSFADDLEARVWSRLSPEHMEFHPYTQVQLSHILEDRAKLALASDALAEGIIGYCAALGAQEHGDARRALTLLRTAVGIAQTEGAAAVTEDHVKTAAARVERNALVECIPGLPVQASLVLWAIYAYYTKTRATLSSGDAYEAYKRVSSQLGLTAVTYRRMFDYVTQLELAGLISSRLVNRGEAGGRTKQISPAGPLEDVMKAITDSPSSELLRALRPPEPEQHRLDT